MVSGKQNKENMNNHDYEQIFSQLPERKQGKASALFFIMLGLFLSFSLMIAGCTKSTPVQSATNSDPSEQQAPVQTTTTMTGDEIIASDKKPSQEQMQDALTLAIADGTYTEEVTYHYHDGGTEVMTVSITVKDDIVTDASLEGIDPAPPSKKYQDGVSASLPDLVIGKKITEIDLPKQISGSSLTTAALREQIQHLIDTY